MHKTWWIRLLFLALALTLGHRLGAQGLPPEVAAMLAREKLPQDALSVVVVDADGQMPPRVLLHASQAMNPASVMKLVTTIAALDLLGPAYTWSTPVYVDGVLHAGRLNGNVYLRGQGDPKLVLERLWLLLRRLQGIGIQTIAGDIVLDNTAFNLPEIDPGQFDGEPLRPYTATPDALLINYKSVLMTFTPDAAAQTVHVQYDPPLAGVSTPATVALSGGACPPDYRGALRADFSNPARIRFAGSYALACGEMVWPVAYADPKSYATRAVQGMWQALGGKLGGVARMGPVPAALLAGRPAFEAQSAPLADVIRDINKFSNNVMAQQVFLTLGGTGSFEAARSTVLRWWKDRLGEDAPLLDNGSGLSREERISALALSRLLQFAWRAPFMPELASSLPISGVDGTLRRYKTRALGSAHLKTGSLSNVLARAGYVHTASGRRYVLVALVNHPQAGAYRPALDALVEWTQREELSR